MTDSPREIVLRVWPEARIVGIIPVFYVVGITSRGQIYVLGNGTTETKAWQRAAERVQQQTK